MNYTPTSSYNKLSKPLEIIKFKTRTCTTSATFERFRVSELIIPLEKRYSGNGGNPSNSGLKSNSEGITR